MDDLWVPYIFERNMCEPLAISDIEESQAPADWRNEENKTISFSSILPFNSW
jgi:hypothetical protein